MPAPAGSDAGTASQLIPSVRQTRGERERFESGKRDRVIGRSTILGLLGAGVVITLAVPPLACAAKGAPKCETEASARLRQGMTQQQVLAIPEFSWPILYARVLWMSTEPDENHLYSARVLVGHSVRHDGPDVAWLYQARRGSLSDTVLVQFKGGVVEHVRCVRLVK